MPSSKAAKPADVVGAAREQGEQAIKLAEAETQANRPNLQSAYGRMDWSRDPVTGDWTGTETLDPASQERLDRQREMQSTSQQRAQQDLSSGMDWSQFGDIIGYDPTEQRAAAEEASYGRSTARLDPQFEARQSALETKLRNQGLTQGDQAYDAAMANLGRERTDAYEMARLGSVGEGRQEVGVGMDMNALANQLRQQGMSEAEMQRYFNLGESERVGGPPITGGPPGSGDATQI